MAKGVTIERGIGRGGTRRRKKKTEKNRWFPSTRKTKTEACSRKNEYVGIINQNTHTFPV